MRCPTLADLPPPPEGKTGWPWTEETSPVPESMPDGKPWPRISIVTPSYNQGQFIEETIRSVLLQGYPDLEYIIIDGGSTDESVKIIRKYERWITFWTSEPDGGQTNAINKGFKRSTGEIVAWLNSDDLYTTGALCTAAKAFAERPHSAVIYGDADTIDAGTTILSHLNSRNFDLQDLYRRDYIRQPASFISAEAIKMIGFLDERFHYAMDYDLWVRLGQEEAVMRYIPRTLAWFRLHGSSKTVSQQEAFWPEEFMLFDMALKRDASDASLAGIAYSHMLRSLIFSHLSQQPHEIFSRTDKSAMNDDNGEAFYQQPLLKILRFISMDHLYPEDDYPLTEALRKAYLVFDSKYNSGENNHSTDVESRWVDEQLILLPNYLLSFEEKTESIRLYKKIIRMRPSLLRYPQTYKFPIRCIARINLVSRIRGA
ncbi:glycosyltransferase family 2 protein [Methanoculleus sp. 7T]|uniref:glycosyltransferase family 2 protein n=1 Tax=Methanoculleus sp. 7T TaxID=2937282 RepID=UPI0020C12686|nr:glycosyltransferase family 2 protein [Methanoculleus sp. 7T]MCK8517537.1 glycosyltransferase [Methanoculleus sp. 7T]